MSLIDHQFLCSLTLNYSSYIEKMVSFIPVHGLGTMTHQVNEYITLNIYLSEIDGRIAHIKQEFHLVDNLKANVLIEIDILATEEITVKLQLKGSVAIIGSCTNITISLSVTTRSTN